ncbi:MAG TPA: hypothetical protein VMK16_19680 [Acidimicrobiales bacterium]|nr:hypothetical protein [Acidimicrobiales bacterium]
MSWLRKDKGDKGAAPVEPEAAAAVEPAPPPPKMVWGKPTRCPECGGPGFLEHIDLRRGVMYQHGRECEHRWEITEAEVMASQDG